MSATKGFCVEDNDVERQLGSGAGDGIMATVDAEVRVEFWYSGVGGQLNDDVATSAIDCEFGVDVHRCSLATMKESMVEADDYDGLLCADTIADARRVIVERAQTNATKAARQWLIEGAQSEEEEGEEDMSEHYSYDPDTDSFDYTIEDIEHFKDIELDMAESKAEEALRPNLLSFREDQDEASKLRYLVGMMRTSKLGFQAECKSADQIEEKSNYMTDAKCDAEFIMSRFVNAICDLYVDENGAEPNTEQLYDLFSDIQQRSWCR